MLEKIIVGVVGTANTGKTTMIGDVVSANENCRDREMKWTIFGKDYRKTIEERGLAINRGGNEECQQVIHDTLLQNAIDAANERSLKRIVMDRTVLDSFAYTYWLYRNKACSVSKETIELMWEQVVRFSRLYSAIIYIPLSKCGEVKVVDDHFRDTDSSYRKDIDDIFAAEFVALSRRGVGMRVVYGDREKRVNWFYSIERELTLSGQLGRADFEGCLSEVKSGRRVF